MMQMGSLCEILINSLTASQSLDEFKRIQPDAQNRLMKNAISSSLKTH